MKKLGTVRMRGSSGDGDNASNTTDGAWGDYIG